MSLTTKQELEYEELRRVKERIEDRYLGKDGVVGIGVGFKEKGGVQTNQLAIRFYVKRKHDVHSPDKLPHVIEGHPVDVIEADFKPEAFPDLHSEDRPRIPPIGVDKKRYDPLVGGVSIAPSRVDNVAGTLGLMVQDSDTGNSMMLSNYHVMCLDDGHGKVGDEMCQEARADNAIGWCGNCAALSRWTSGNVKVGSETYGVDGAVARLTARRATLGSIVGIGTVAGSSVATVGMKVLKRGRTTELTSGTVDDVAATVQEDFGTGVGKVNMKNQVVVISDGGPFSAGGDSGSAYVEKDSAKVVALHWGGTGSGRSVGSPIAAVLSSLNITIVTTGEETPEPPVPPKPCNC